MKSYHKIQTVYKRNPKTKVRALLEGDYSLPEFSYLQNNVWEFTEKVDGTNIRVMFNGQDVTFGGKTDNASIPSLLVSRLNDRFMKFPILQVFREKFKDGVCFYGEGYGAKIQKGGGNYRQDQDFVLFDVKIGHWWLQRKDVCEIAHVFGIDVVPAIGQGTLKEMVQMAKAGFKSRWGDFQAEGIVARPLVELNTRGGNRVITKIKCKDLYE